jgi:ferredoxin
MANSRHLRVNPIDCAAHGLCAELLPERIGLDEWGYPVLDERPLDPELLAWARRAAAACPTLALTVTSAPRR